MSVDTTFRKELKSMLTSVKQNNYSTLSEKHVSWVTLEEDETKTKKAPPSTPFPRKKSSKEDLKLNPTTLSFNEDDLKGSIEERNTKKRKVSESTQDYIDFKQKLSKNAAVSSGLNSGWLEIDVSSPIPAAESDISAENIITSEIDPEGTIAKEILNKIKESKVLENASTTDESVEITFESDMEQIEVNNGNELSSSTLFSYEISESFDSDSSDENILKVPKIVKNPAKFKKQCKIVEFEKPVTLLSKKYINNKQTSLSMDSTDTDKKSSDISIERKKKLKKNKRKVTKSSEKNLTNPIVITSTERIEDLSNDDVSSEDQDFLQDNEVYLNSTKEIVHDSIESDSEIVELNNNLKFYVTKNHCLLILTHPIKLYFYGKINMSVLTGAVEVLGHVFKENTENFEIYSPRGQAYLYIKTKETANNKNIHNILKSYNINEKIENTNNVSVIALKFLKNPIINCLVDHTYQQLFPKVTSISEERPLSLIEMRLQCYFETESVNWPVLKISEQWEACIDSLNHSKGKKILACGGKNVGKSTFLRFATNRLLEKFEKVVYIDLDPGQSEFTLPGCISITFVDKPLLGPNYTHLKKPERCIFLGEVNVAHCFNRYLNAIKELMSFYNEEVDQTLPCLINYMGFTKGLGLDLITSVLYIVNPATLIQIESSDRKHNYKSHLTNDFVKKYSKSLPYKDNMVDLDYDLIVLNSIASTIKGKSEFEPKVMRNMNITAYFAQTLTTGNESIASVPPYCASLSSLNLKHINETNENLLAILNGNLVALCVDSASNCLGFGIVRGIDTNSDKIYIITPESKSIMNKINTLVMGTIMLPPSFYTTGGSCEESHPYICKTIRRATTDVPKRVYTACRNILSQK